MKHRKLTAAELEDVHANAIAAHADGLARDAYAARAARVAIQLGQKATGWEAAYYAAYAAAADAYDAVYHEAYAAAIAAAQKVFSTHKRKKKK